MFEVVEAAIAMILAEFFVLRKVIFEALSNSVNPGYYRNTAGVIER